MVFLDYFLWFSKVNMSKLCARIRFLLLALLLATPACEKAEIVPGNRMGGEGSAEPVMGVRQMVAVHCVPAVGSYSVIGVTGSCPYDQVVYTQPGATSLYYVTNDLQALEPGSSVSGHPHSLEFRADLGGRTIFALNGLAEPYESIATAGTGSGFSMGAVGYAKLVCQDSTSGAVAFAYASNGNHSVVLRGPQGQTYDFDQATFTEQGTVWTFDVAATSNHPAFQVSSDLSNRKCGAQGAVLMNGTAFFTRN